jgi:hypothetical protein
MNDLGLCDWSREKVVTPRPLTQASPDPRQISYRHILDTRLVFTTPFFGMKGDYSDFMTTS